MVKFRSAAITAAAFYLVMASAAQAGGPTATMTANPTSALAGTPVDMTMTIEEACTPIDPAPTFDLIDYSNNNDVVCTGSVTAGVNPTTATCTATFADPATPGVPALRNVGFEASGLAPACLSIFQRTPHTVLVAAAAVPTVGEWTMWGLAGLIALGGGVLLSRRARRFV